MFVEEKPANLLTVNGNTKAMKSSARGYTTGILHLAPYTTAGENVCPAAKRAGCHKACLNTAGRGRFDQVQASRVRKTHLFFDERLWFMAQLHRDIESLERRCQREQSLPAVRLNGTSDIDWQRIPYYMGKVKYNNIFQAFPLVKFYDYTKYLPPSTEKNYHLTFSYSGEPEFQVLVDKAMTAGMNIAVVFKNGTLDEFMGRPVIDGDIHDLRFLDPANCIVGLSAKGKAQQDLSEFAVDCQAHWDFKKAVGDGL